MIEWQKLIRLIVVVIALVYLAVTDVIDSDVAAGGVTTLIGYVIGNGRNAARGVASPPLISPRESDPPDGTN